jgi:hypothetical protein
VDDEFDFDSGETRRVFFINKIAYDSMWKRFVIPSNTLILNSE